MSPRRKPPPEEESDTGVAVVAGADAEGPPNRLPPPPQPDIKSASASDVPIAARSRQHVHLWFSVIPQSTVQLRPGIYGLAHNPVDHCRRTVAIARRPLRRGAANMALRFSIPGDPRIQQMILPDAVDAKIFPGIALADKAAVFEEAGGGRIGRNTGRLHTMQPQRGESERDHRAHGRRHVAAAHERQAHPVADAGSLCDAATDVGERQSADHDAVGIAYDQKRVALVGPQILGIASDAAPERASRQIVRRPDRLPRLEKLAAALAQRRPFGVIGHLRRAQRHAFARDGGERLGKIDGAKKRHRRPTYRPTSTPPGNANARPRAEPMPDSLIRAFSGKVDAGFPKKMQPNT